MIDRHDHRLRILIPVLVSLCVPTTGQCDRPNIILIVTDDQSPLTLAAYGNEVCQTPNLDRLAGEGLTFDAAYHMGSWSGAVCTPSRHMIMTGRTVWHIPDRRRNARRASRTTESERSGQGPRATEFGRFQHARDLQPSRLRHISHLQARQQLRGRERAVYGPARRHETRWHGRNGQCLAWGSCRRVPSRKRIA